MDRRELAQRIGEEAAGRYFRSIAVIEAEVDLRQRERVPQHHLTIEVQNFPSSTWSTADISTDEEPADDLADELADFAVAAEEERPRLQAVPKGRFRVAGKAKAKAKAKPRPKTLAVDGQSKRKSSKTSKKAASATKDSQSSC